MSSSDAPTPAPLSLFAAFKTNAWTDLALTMPIFVGYHLGVVTLNVRNAADFFTQKLIAMAERNILVYWGITLAIGAAIFLGMSLLGAGAAFDKKRFVLVAVEGVLYAVLMRSAAIYAVGALPMSNADAVGGPVPALVMSLGAGFYEEVAFRVVLFGGGLLAMSLFFGGVSKLVLASGWGLVCAAVFSGWHYIGPLGDPWNLHSFVFRTVCGLVFTLIFVLRGFAPAVWTHALYDIWVMVFH
jgi:hypothetical protein